MNVLEVPAGTGSGFVWDDKGHIVTNFHVIRCDSLLLLVFVAVGCFSSNFKFGRMRRVVCVENH